MIKYIKKDIVTIEAPAIIAHGCNCQGAFNAGVAKAIRNKWPSAFTNYKKICDIEDDKSKLLGDVVFVIVGEECIVANCFTQLNYGRSGVFANLDAIEKSFKRVMKLAKIMKEDRPKNSPPIYMPKIGCGLGGLDWETSVRPLIERLLSEEEVELEVIVVDV